MRHRREHRYALLVGAWFGLVTLHATPALAGDQCAALGLGNAQGIHGALVNALGGVVPNKGANGGLGNEMWGTVVDQDGVVCAVAFTGGTRIDQWPGSRVISAQKANTATSFSLPAGGGGTVDALSTANLWKQVQPGGTLFGLQFSNPVDPAVAYGNNPAKYGRTDDPLVGRFIGGVNVFGGGLALYNKNGQKVGGLGVSGDTSCADHNIAWRVRHALNLDFLTTAGVSGLTAPPLQDNIIYNVANPFGHPACGFGEEAAVLPPTQ
jgi:uncharacterized protein GlcG (DUF336 family)